MKSQISISKALVVTVGILLFLSLVYYIYLFLQDKNNTLEIADYNKQEITVGSQRLSVYLADSEAKKEIGLAGFDSLNDNEGMLFPYQPVQIPAFWMKNMKFAIDIIWIRDGKIVEITKNVPLELNKFDSELKRYYPKEEIDQVLEVNAGWSEKNQIGVGDNVK